MRNGIKSKISQNLFFKWMMVVVILFSLFASVFFVSCGEAEEIVVSYVDAEGKRRTMFVQSGTTIGQLDAKEIDGYEFNGWFKNQDLTIVCSLNEKIEEDVSLYAKYTAKKYKVIYDGNGGVGDKKEVIYNYNESYSLIENPFTRNGYAFKSGENESGWNTKADGFGYGRNPGDSLRVSEPNDITYYAQWKAVDYTITLKLNQGDGSSTYKTYTIEDEISLMTPSGDGYTFLCWEVDSIDETGPNNWSVGRTYAKNEIITGKFGNVTLKAIYS